MDAATVAPQIDDRALADSIRTWLEGLEAHAEASRTDAPPADEHQRPEAR
jgi:hypothetical protein